MKNICFYGKKETMKSDGGMVCSALRRVLYGSLCLVSVFLAVPAKAELVLARDGKTDYRIVTAAQRSDTERFALDELTNFLQRVTGAVFPVEMEGAADGGKGPAIYLGWTAYAAAGGIDAASLGEEEWAIRTVENNLILCGGRPRGTLYAVYEFLEKEIGCHWLAKGSEVIPSRPFLQIGSLEVQSKPHFWKRAIGNATYSSIDHWFFQLRNRNYRHDLIHRFSEIDPRFPKDMLYPMVGTPDGLHTFSKYVNAKDWFEEHPEYFALVGGKRIPAYDSIGPGQLCLTHPDVRRIVLEKLRENIKMDREAAAAENRPPPKIYHIMQNDKYDTHCQCENCRAIAVREESESGPLVDFLNAIGAAIEPEYPELLLATLSYNRTQPPPKTIRPRANVLIAWCDVYSRSDHMRPLSHPWNERHYNEIRRWGEISEQVGIGDDYWPTLGYYADFPLPWTIAPCIAADLKLFAEVGCDTYYAEAYYYTEPGKNFIDLEYWLAFQLLVDPFQPAEPLYKTFFEGYYGAAASAMRAYYDYLTGRIDAEAQYMFYRNAPHMLAYLDLEFFKTTERMFDEAMASVEPDSLFAAHVMRDRFIVDGALLHLWPWLEFKLLAEEQMPFEKDALVDRYETGWDNYTRHWYNSYYSLKVPLSHNRDGNRRKSLVAMFRNPTLPEQFKNLPRGDVADFTAITFARSYPSQVNVHDEDAYCGLAVEPRAMSSILLAEEGAPLEGDKAEAAPQRELRFGATGGPVVTLKWDEIPRDGKYHIYPLGRVQIKPTQHPSDGSGGGARPGTIVWALAPNRLGVCVDRVYDPEAKGANANIWNVFISLKADGPAYVSGSVATNTVRMDRVLLVRPRAEDEPTAEELRLQEEEAARQARRPQISLPAKTEEAGGDLAGVSWEQAVVTAPWATLEGEAAGREIRARLSGDSTHLYVELFDPIDTAGLQEDPGVFDGDDWELLITKKRDGLKYRQMAINPGGHILELVYGEAADVWDSGAIVKSELLEDGWRVRMALPRERLTESGAADETIFLNLMRNGPNQKPWAWSPTFSGGFHNLEQTGEVRFNRTEN